jgi:hypothetical protein
VPDHPDRPTPRGDAAEASDLTVTIGPRRFGGTRDVLTATAFGVGLVVTIVVAVVAGLPGVIGTVYVLTAFAAWVQAFRRSWRISADRIEARRWVRWHTLDRADVSAIEAARDEMGIRAVALSNRGLPLEIDVDDVRVEPLLAEALGRFVSDCGDDGIDIDPLVPTIVRR